MTHLALLPPSLAVSPPLPLKLLSASELTQEIDFWIRQTMTGANPTSRKLAHDYVRLCEEHLAAFLTPPQLVTLVKKVDAIPTRPVLKTKKVPPRLKATPVEEETAPTRRLASAGRY